MQANLYNNEQRDPTLSKIRKLNIIFNCLNLFAWIPVQIFIFSLFCRYLKNQFKDPDDFFLMVAIISIGSISFVLAIVYSAMNLAFHYPEKPKHIQTHRVQKWARCIKVILVLVSTSYGSSLTIIMNQTLSCNTDANGNFFNRECIYKNQSSLNLGWVLTLVNILVGYPQFLLLFLYIKRFQEFKLYRQAPLAQLHYSQYQQPLQPQQATSHVYQQQSQQPVASTYEYKPNVIGYNK